MNETDKLKLLKPILISLASHVKKYLETRFVQDNLWNQLLWLFLQTIFSTKSKSTSDISDAAMPEDEAKETKNESKEKVMRNEKKRRPILKPPPVSLPKDTPICWDSPLLEERNVYGPIRHKVKRKTANYFSFAE